MNIRSIIAADGLPRRAFTVAEVERMVEVGLIEEGERVELVEGELIPISPQGNQHEVLKSAILERFHAVRPSTIRIGVETILRLSNETFLVPDIILFPIAVGFKGLNGPAVLLAVEIGVSSLAYDLGRKARIYAAFGVPELWVIDAGSSIVHVHRHPGPDGYADITPWHADHLIRPTQAPAFTLRLADLDLTD
ncbi:Uma2 family endonuclease [Mongoliimonas terrestris]|uniref:Uma2 family endonuclease n=1 Tax=Mongoliimonas terrestris TaxID=1709001 RepID=UPI0009497620|nr:Uma2 family endonuclease [Mongoliimonas terrestris]